MLAAICAFTLLYLLMLGKPVKRSDAVITVTLVLACIAVLMEQFGRIIHYTDWSFRLAVPVTWIIIVGRIYNLWPKKMNDLLDRSFDR